MNVRFLPEFISFFQFRKGCAITNANVPFILQYAYARAQPANLQIHRLTRLKLLNQAVGIKWQLGCYGQ
jgi:hypothetical protein